MVRPAVFPGNRRHHLSSAFSTTAAAAAAAASVAGVLLVVCFPRRKRERGGGYPVVYTSPAFVFVASFFFTLRSEGDGGITIGGHLGARAMIYTAGRN